MNLHTKVMTALERGSFRPQQGLSIMNHKKHLVKVKQRHCFRPQQGLSIMNLYPHSALKRTCDRFRPQQGLSIMNWLCCYTLATLTRTVSVPNRG